MIPDEAVEAAAKAHFNRGEGYWGDMIPEAKAEALDDMRAALEAAAPHMLAEAWDRGFKACDGEWEQTADLVTPDEDRFVATNPYRSQA